MPRRVNFGAWVGAFVLTVLSGTSPAADLIEPSGEAALAWRLDAISGSTLGPTKPDPVWRQCIALLEAASRLNPSELRFPRLRELALSHIGDTAGAIAAMRDYRRLAPADRIAQLELIDLYASRMETVDGRIEYFTSLLEKQDLPVELRSAIAVKAAALLAQKSPELAAQMATRAVRLYPLAQATRLYYRYVGRQEKDLPRRIAALLAVLKSDPNQPAYLQELATLLASHGMADASLQWYDLAIFTMLRSGTPIPPGFHNFVIDYASVAVVGGRLAFADTMAAQLIEQQPLDADAWFVKLTAAKTNSPQLYDHQVDEARAAFIRRWNSLHEQVLSGGHAPAPGEATTHIPTDASDTKVEALDPAPVVEKLKAEGNTQNKEATISVVSDLAWFHLYFDVKPDQAAKWIEVLRPLLSRDSMVMQRLDGWYALAAGRPQQARDILSKIADKDALSEFGLMRADDAEKKNVDPARITHLLEDNRIGLVAAMLWAALKTEANRPATQPASNEVLAELAKFPGQFLAVLDPNSVGRVYNIRAEPLETNLSFGSPVLARVTINNNGTDDITIGQDALLHRDLWFDARTLGFEQQTLSGVAFDQIENALVLHAHESTSQIVRLDSGVLRAALAHSPATSTTVNCGVMTNPLAVHGTTPKDEQMVAGPGGTASNFYSTFTYAGVNLLLPSGKKQVDDGLNSASPVDKMHSIDLLAAYWRLAQEPSTDRALKVASEDLPGSIFRLRDDKSPLVGGWASYVLAGITKGADQEKIVSDMAASGEWSARLLSLFAGDAVPASKRRELATTLSNDSDQTVKAAAMATVELLEQAQKNSTSQPATGDAGK